MSSPKLIESLPQLVGEGLISTEQAERIRARYATDAAHSGDRMLLVFAILGCLLVGMGIILIVAHNWDDLPRTARTVMAFLPVLLGQGLVWYALQRKPDAASWREGGAVLLACGLCACVALISQIYHISGNLEDHLFTCALLIVPLLYLPGSLIVALCYLGIIAWYGWLFHFEHGLERPWLLVPLFAAAVPFYVKEARRNGTGLGFWWLSLCMALAVGLSSQLFYTDWAIEHALGAMGVAAAFALVPWLHTGRPLRTWPWVLVGGAAMLLIFCIFSFRSIWHDGTGGMDAGARRDLPTILLFCAMGATAYAISLRKRKPFDGHAYPEGWWLFLVCYGVSLASPIAATILVNLSLLTMGVITMKHGIERDSLRRMNLGLAIISITILMRFFDTDMSFVLRGLVFIAIGCGFLYMNLRMVRARDKHKNAS